MSHVDANVDWDRLGLAEALDSRPEHTRAVAWGDGTRYHVGPDPEDASQLEIFPEAGVARLISRDVEVTLFRQSPPSHFSDHVRFEQVGTDERVELTLTKQGRARLDIVPAPVEQRLEPVAQPASSPPLLPPLPASPPPPEADDPHAERDTPAFQNAELRADADGTGTDIPLAPETPVIAHSGGAETPLPAPSDTQESTVATTSAPEERRERLTLTGRLGRTPSFRTTRNGTVVASFPVAVREEDGSTTWHTILAFGERAERLREGLTKGQPIEVIGYRHERERQTRSGETRRIEEIYATVVKPR